MKIAIIGAGNIGSALAFGLAQGKLVRKEDICISNPHPGKLERIREREPEIRTTTSNPACIQGADVVVLAVKPWIVQSVADELKPLLDYEKQIVCSMVGGLGLADLKELFVRDGQAPALYYLIPNTAIATRQSMTFLASAGATPEQDEALLAVFKELGDAMLVEEKLMNGGMVLASCGIAFALRYLHANVQGGVQLGFRPADAQRIVAQTLVGAASLMDAPGAHPEEEIDKVTTPGGLTIRGLNAMERKGFTASVLEGIQASLPQKK